MSYPQLDDHDFEKKILEKKEFKQFKVGDYDFRHIDNAVEFFNLEIQSYQHFVKNLINIGTSYSRLLVMFSTGAGKTLTAISVAMQFVEIYNKYRNNLRKYFPGIKNLSIVNNIVPSVFVLGFGNTESAFIRDLLRYPELGFITREEKETLAKYKQLSSMGDVFAKKNYSVLLQRLKSRITNKERGGFFTFYGYQEFVNSVFGEYINLVALIKNDADAVRSTEIIQAEIDAGRLKLNKNLVNILRNSLIICDESQELYNSLAKNSYGLIVKYILDTISGTRCLFLSATPINSSAREVIDVLQLLGANVAYSDIFKSPTEYKDGALQRIGELSRGRVSYVRDANIDEYPERILDGLDLTVDNKPLEYIKFIPCQISDLHRATMAGKPEAGKPGAGKPGAETETGAETGPGAGPGTGPGAGPDDDETSHHSSAADIVFPTETGGTFNSSAVKAMLVSGSDWRQTMGIEVAPHNTLGGPILHEDTLVKYSGKYAEMVRQIKLNYKNRGGKIMIYHDKVQTSGVLLIEQILLQNGIVPEHGEPVGSTLCIYCGQPKGDHSAKAKDADHSYAAARYIVAHGLLGDDNKMMESFVRYNDPKNADGAVISILIGSQLIKQSYEFLNTRNLYIMSCPSSVSILLQIYGRLVRKNSHLNLPRSLRQVHIKHFINVDNLKTNAAGQAAGTAAGTATGTSTPDTDRWRAKIDAYKLIQQAELSLYKYALDADVHRKIIGLTDDTKGDYVLGQKWYSPMYNVPESIDTSTFISNNYWIQEINNIIFIIKKLFILNPVWTAETLVEAVRKPPFSVQFNPEMIDIDNIYIALDRLLEINYKIVKSKTTNKYDMIENLLNPNSSRIFIGLTEYRIKSIGPYYIRFPRNETDNDSYHISDEYNIDAYKYLHDADNKALTIPITDIISKSVSAAETWKKLYSMSNINDIIMFPILDQKTALETYINTHLTEAGHTKPKFVSTMVRYRAIIKLKHLQKYPNVYDLYMKSKPQLPAHAKYIGYCSANSGYELWHKTLGWIYYASNVLPYNVKPDNPSCKGIIDYTMTDYKFKLIFRKTTDNLEGDTIYEEADGRKVLKGMVCTTMSKADIRRVLDTLNIKELTNRRDMCAKIQKKLLELEATSDVRWFDFWWN